MPDLTRYRSDRPVSSLRREVDRLFNEFFPSFEEEGERSPSLWSPRVDLSETDDTYMISMDLPGMSREDVKIELRDNKLTVSGERREEKEEEERDYRRVERSYGRFYRSFQLPSAAAEKDVKARLDNGVLRIEVPKAEEHKPRRIEIS